MSDSETSIYVLRDKYNARIAELEGEVERLRERHLHYCQVQARIDAALEMCEHDEGCPPECIVCTIRAALTGEKTATAKELIEGTQKLTFKEKDEATGFIPLQIDKTYEEDQ